MSGWDAYVNHICQMGTDWAALVGKKDQKVWAKSQVAGDTQADSEKTDLNLQKLVGDFGNFDQLRANGITIRPGVKFMVTRADEEFVHGRKADQTVLVVDFGDGIMVATHGPNSQAGDVVAKMTTLAKYLKETASTRQ
ncbi:hypothetical protein IWW50_005590 [Coemansia erecta]|nr:hypothetical protein GGF43_004231 [Coemansia sp. RSA 2618]KAJ2819071.1 hypothetical protein IWW50_005590 [Coemansia erecta]